MRRALAFAVASGGVVYLALRDGGYDLIARHEAGLVLWALVALGFAFGVFPRGRLRWFDLLPLAAAAGLALLMLLSLTWSGSAERTFDELSRLGLYAGILALPLLGLNRHTWRAAAAGLAAGAAAVAVFAVATRLAPDQLPTAEVTVLFGNNRRLSYPLEYWNAVATWGAIAAAMTLAYSAHLRSRVLRAVSLAAVPLAAVSVYLTYSRAGAIGIAVGAVAVVALSRNRWTALVHGLVAAGATGVGIAVIRGQPAIAEGLGGEGGGSVAAALAVGALACGAAGAISGAVGLDRLRLPRPIARRAAPVAAVLAVVAALVVGGGALGEYWDEFQNQRAVTAEADPAQRFATGAGTRSDVWDTALDLFASEPVRGIGPGTFEFAWSEGAPVQEFMRDAHSLYLEQLAELGLPGLLLLLAFLGGGLALAIVARVGLRRSSEVGAAVAAISAAVVFLVGAGVDWMWELTAVSVLGLAAIGVGMAAGLERDPRRRMPATARIAAVAGALVMVLVQVPGLISTARTRESGEALAGGRIGEARQLASEGIDAEPWAATPYAARAAVHTRNGDYDAARVDIGEAIEREPDNWRHRLALVQIELAAGRRAAAEDSFQVVRDLSLTSAVPHRDAAALGRDPMVRQAIRDGCLGYRFGACGARPARAEGRACLPGETASAAIRDVRGVELDEVGVVRVAELNAPPVFYVAGDAGGRLTTWAIDGPAYRTGVGDVVPLNEAARGAVTAGGVVVDPAVHGLSPSDEGVDAARSCLRRSEGPER